MRPFSGRLADISDLEARIHPAFNVVVGAANANAYEPQNIEHVQFSLPTQMAFALLGKGNGYAVHRDYLDGKIDMPQVMAIARGIRIIEAPELEQRYPGKFVADVTVTFRDGMSEHVFVEDPVGTLETRCPRTIRTRSSWNSPQAYSVTNEHERCWRCSGRWTFAPRPRI